MDHLRGATEANVTYSQLVATNLKELVDKWRAANKPEDTPIVSQEMDEATAQPPTKKRTTWMKRSTAWDPFRTTDGNSPYQKLQAYACLFLKLRSVT